MAGFEGSIPHLLEGSPNFEDHHESDAYNKQNQQHIISRSDNNTGSTTYEQVGHKETVEIRFQNNPSSFETGGRSKEESGMDVNIGTCLEEVVEEHVLMEDNPMVEESVVVRESEVVEDAIVDKDVDGQQQVVSSETMVSNVQQQSPVDLGDSSQDVVHPIEKESYIFTCPFCFERYKDADALKVHLPTHMEIKTTAVENDMKSKANHQCGECEKAFDSNELLYEHLQVHKRQSTESERFKCDICGKEFRTRYGLSNHANAHQLDEYRCNVCKQYFMDEESLITHSMEHTKVKKEFVEENQVETMVSEEKLEARKLDNTPDESSTTVQGGEISENVVDLQDYRYKCKFCGKLFKRKVLHTIHLRTHTGEKPFACKHCPKAFARKYVLTYHERVHSGEKPHQCTQCDKAFATPASLHAHNRVHTGHKPYCCLHCGRKFALRSSLRVHQAIHMETKDFKCEKCSKAFSLRKYLNRHVKKCPVVAKHKHECSQCNEAFPTKTRLASHQRICEIKTEEEEKRNTAEVNDVLDSKSVSSPVESSTKKQVASVKPALQCRFCPKLFKKLCLLTRHERVHTGEKPFACEYCPQRFSRKEGVRQHERIHTGETPYCCEFCDRSYRSASSLRDHQKSHFKCSVCHQRFNNVQAAETHENTHKLAYTCIKCDQRFRSKRLLDSHARAHEDNTMVTYTCAICKEVFGTRAHLTMHKSTHHETDNQSESSGRVHNTAVVKNETDEEQSDDLRIHKEGDEDTQDFYQCGYCGQREISVFRLESHERSHTDERPHSCTKCTKAFVRKDALVLHESDCNFVGRIPCVLCNRTFQSEFTLKLHQKSHTKNDSLNCKYCEQVLDTVEQLQQHETEHVHVKGSKKAHKYKCGFCGKTYQKDCRRIVHERSHTGEKPYQCTLCPKRFARKDSLKAHIWTHSNSKPFSCQLCDKTFKLKSNLSAHLKSLHDVDEGFVCQECGKSFRSDKSLRQHELVHTSNVVCSGNLKVYVCQYCEQSFRRLKAFAKHLKREHTEENRGRNYKEDEDDDDDNAVEEEEDEKDADYVPDDDCNNTSDTSKTLYQCSVCDKKETSIYRLETHEQTHSEERPHTCQNCSKGFILEEALKLHDNVCKSRKPISCEVCGKIYKNQSAFRMHKKTHDKKPHLCSVCGIVVSSSLELREHRKTHTVDVLRNYYCTECPKSFTHKNSLSNHIDTCHRDPRRPKCEHCGETFVNKGWLKQHMYVRHYEVLAVTQQMRSQNQPVPTSDNEVHESHVSSMINTGAHQSHQPEPVKTVGAFENLNLQSTMDCIETLAAFSSLQGDVLHQVGNKDEIHHDPRGDDLLQVEFSSVNPPKQLCGDNETVDFIGSSDGDGAGTCMDNLNLHMGESCDTVPGSAPSELKEGEEKDTLSEISKPVKEVKKHPCKLCSRRFRKKSELRNHTRTHTGEKPFLCNQCGKRFKVVSGLKAHEDRHLGVKRYKCTECNKEYANPSGLREHMDAHKGIKRYQCVECPKSFRQRQSLKEHLDVHRGYRQYQCDTCPRSFSQRRSWRMHMRSHGKIV